MSDENDLSIWDDASNDVENEKNNSSRYDDGKSLFLRLEKGKSYTIRLIKQPECFRLHWLAFKSIQRGPVTSPAFKETDKDMDVAWSKGGWIPTKRYAAPVINRELNKIQLLEGGVDIFTPIIGLYSQTKKKAAEGKGVVINPAGEPAPDWIITVSSKLMKNGKERMSFVCQADVTSGMNYFTEEDKELISKFTYDWRKHYEKKTPEEIEELWDSLPDDKKYHPNRQKQVAVANPGKKTEPAKTASVAPPKDNPKDSIKQPVAEDGPFGEPEPEEEEEDGENAAATLF